MDLEQPSSPDRESKNLEQNWRVISGLESQAGLGPSSLPNA